MLAAEVKSLAVALGAPSGRFINRHVTDGVNCHNSSILRPVTLLNDNRSSKTPSTRAGGQALASFLLNIAWSRNSCNQRSLSRNTKSPGLQIRAVNLGRLPECVRKRNQDHSENQERRVADPLTANADGLDVIQWRRAATRDEEDDDGKWDRKVESI